MELLYLYRMSLAEGLSVSQIQDDYLLLLSAWPSHQGEAPAAGKGPSRLCASTHTDPKLPIQLLLVGRNITEGSNPELYCSEHPATTRESTSDLLRQHRARTQVLRVRTSTRDPHRPAPLAKGLALTHACSVTSAGLGRWRCNSGSIVAKSIKTP